MSRLVRRSLAAGEPSEQHAGTGASEWSSLTALLAAAPELASCTELDALTLRAVELLRSRIGLERAGLFLHDPSSDGFTMRGTWGTGANGETTDERDVRYESCAEDCERLCELRARGALWLYYDDVPHFSEQNGQRRSIGQGWLAVTPLVAARHLVGVLYNDTALSHAPVDESKQGLAAAFTSLVASLVLARRGRPAWGPLPGSAEQSSVVKWVVQALDQDPLASGERLAHELGISPGHLARSFKAQMDVSLVEYRNRLRIDRFFDRVARQGGSLLDAALEAGFGSYAQFHRVYRKLQRHAAHESAAHIELASRRLLAKG